MIKRLLLLIALFGLVSPKRRYAGVDKIRGLKNLLGALDNNFYATCELALFTTPMSYTKAAKQCTKFQIGVKAKKGNLVTLDSKEKQGHLMFLYDIGLGVPKEAQSVSVPEVKRFGPYNWIWTGLQKVTNTEVKGVRKKTVKDYNPNEWKWQGTGESPLGYSNWPKKRSQGQPDQNWMKKRKKKGCKNNEGCYQNQVRVDASGYWDDGWEFEEHVYACDYRGKYILSNLQKTWKDAKKACEKAGLTLAMVRNLKEVKEMQAAIQFFLGPDNEDLDKWDSENWVWLGGNDLKKEGVYKWLNGKKISDKLPWIKKAGGDNADYLPNSDGQHAISFSRWGVLDDSFHGHKKRKRPFACQCPDT